MVNIIVVFAKQEDANRIKNLLVRHGHHVAAVCTTGNAVIHKIDQMLDADGLIISGYRFGDMTYHELYHYLPGSYNMMVMASQLYLDEVYEYNVVKVRMPVKSHELMNTLNIMEDTLLRKRKREKAKPREKTDAEIELIEYAKSVLMTNKNMTEDQAHRYLQKVSMDNGTNVIETSQMVIDLFGQI